MSALRSLASCQPLTDSPNAVDQRSGSFPSSQLATLSPSLCERQGAGRGAVGEEEPSRRSAGARWDAAPLGGRGPGGVGHRVVRKLLAPGERGAGGAPWAFGGGAGISRAKR